MHQPQTMEGLSAMFLDFKELVLNELKEIKADGKATLEKATLTNGRVNKHDWRLDNIEEVEIKGVKHKVTDLVKSMYNDVESLLHDRKRLWNLLKDILLILAGGSTVANTVPELVRKIFNSLF